MKRCRPASARGEMKAVLMREAETEIDELLDWNEQAGQPTLTEIEDVILKLRKRMSEAMAVTVIKAHPSVSMIGWTPSPYELV